MTDVSAFARHLLGVDPLATEAIGQNLYSRFRDLGQKGRPSPHRAASTSPYGMGGPLRDRVQA